MVDNQVDVISVMNGAVGNAGASVSEAASVEVGTGLGLDLKSVGRGLASPDLVAVIAGTVGLGEAFMPLVTEVVHVAMFEPRNWA